MPHKARSKYGAVPTTVDGITFDSKAEARHYGELSMRLKIGEIRELVLQPRFELWAFALDPAVAQLVGVYVADFQYEELDKEAWGAAVWRVVVADVKGVRTALYCWKKRHMMAQHGIKIREVR